MVRDKILDILEYWKVEGLTIPKEVREKLGIKDGDFVDFYLQDMDQLK